MAGNIKESAKEKRKVGNSVFITGVLFGITLVGMVIFLISKVALGASMAPGAVIAGAAWSLLAMPAALLAFSLSLMWGRVTQAKQVTIKTILTLVILFLFMLYFMFAVLVVWVVKVDNTPQEGDTAYDTYIEETIEEKDFGGEFS